MTNLEKLRVIFPHTIFIFQKREDKTEAIMCSNEWLEAEYNEKNMSNQEAKDKFLNILFEIQEAVWGIDIPSPTVPEYREHHEQCQELLALIDKKIKEVEEG